MTVSDGACGGDIEELILTVSDGACGGDIEELILTVSDGACGGDIEELILTVSDGACGGDIEELESQLQLFNMSELVWSLCEILFVNTLPGQFYIGLESVRDPLRQHSPRSVLYWSGVCARSSSSTLCQVSSILVWSLCEILFVNTLPGQFYIGLESVRDPLRQHSARSVLYWSGVCARSSSSTLCQVSSILVWSLCEILFVNTLPGQFYIGLESVRDPLRQHSPRSVLYWSGVCARSSSSTLSQVSSILVWSLCEILFVNTLPGQFYIGLESVRDPLRQHSPRSVLYWSGVCARSSSSTLSQVSSILVWSLCEILFVNTLPGQFYIGLESV